MIACEECRGLGWVKRTAGVDVWPVPCPGCGGRGRWTLRGLARGIARDRDERRRLFYALERLEHGARVRSETAAAVLEAMARAGLVAPVKVGRRRRGA